MLHDRLVLVSSEEIQEMDTAESSAEVRAFYERHPYPAPVTDLSGYREHWEQWERRRAFEFFQRLWRHDQIVLDASGI